MMKKLILLIIMIYIPSNILASDYLADFISENYKESDSTEVGIPKIYHTIQVETEIGSKVLMLKGDDPNYRLWFRQYLATAKKLIITVPKEQDSLFKDSKIFQIDVNLVHPFYGSKWKEPEPEPEPEVIVEPPKPPYKGKKHIMIVDDNSQKRDLIQMIVKKLGFPVTIASNSHDALKIFTNQPDKFNLVIADGNIYKGVSSTTLVKSILETSPDIPVILGTDYKEEKTTAMLTDFFAGFSRVIVKPLVLKELSKTILQVLEKKV
ncbi:MAG: response regulator [Desulfamplus sp.]|nr:response regulator [Desulfamplus sp.]